MGRKEKAENCLKSVWVQGIVQLHILRNFVSFYSIKKRVPGLVSVSESWRKPRIGDDSVLHTSEPSAWLLFMDCIPTITSNVSLSTKVT